MGMDEEVEKVYSKRSTHAHEGQGIVFNVYSDGSSSKSSSSSGPHSTLLQRSAGKHGFSLGSNVDPTLQYQKHDHSKVDPKEDLLKKFTDIIQKQKERKKRSTEEETDQLARKKPYVHVEV